LVHKADHSDINVSALGTLPVGFRPPAKFRFTAFHPSTGTANIDIDAAGVVTVFVSNLDWLDISAVFFSVSP